jgi:uncharacterized damage-inducible protein DinB
MAAKEIIQTLYDYNDWANQRIFAAAEKLAEGQWEEPNQVVQRDLRTLLFHIVRTEWVWRQLAQNQGQLPTPPQMEDLDTLPLIKEFSQVEACQIQSYLNDLTEEDLAAKLEMTDRRGRKTSLAIWQMLAHAVMHGMQHRAEAAAILTRLGQSPGDIDFIYFL